MTNNTIPCPFCGSTDVSVIATQSGKSAYCGTCNASGPLARTHTESLQFWARRSQSAAAAVRDGAGGAAIPGAIKVEARMTKRTSS